jgi:hypothetical protein
VVLPAATRRGVRGWPHDGASARRLLLAGAAVLTGLSGVLLGTAPSGIEPGGEWVDCGRALFHDRNRLPHPDCAASYEPFQSAAITLVVISVVLLFLVPFQRTGPDYSLGNTDALKRPGRWALLTGLAAVVLLSGCAVLDQTPDPGPLGEGAGEDSDEICVPASPRGEYAFGAEVLHNPSGDDAVITGLRLVDAKGVELVGAVVVDLNGSSSVGAHVMAAVGPREHPAVEGRRPP